MAGNYDGTLRYDTKIDTDGFDKGSEEIKKKAKTTGNEAKKSLEDTRDSLENINKVSKTILLTAASVGAGILAMGISYNAQMEQYTAGFTTMLGSAEKANKVLGDLKNFAAKTPFELTDLANASTTLLAFGEDVNQLMPDLKMLGDISLGNAEKFKGLALVFGQVQSQGKLMGQDLLQMINQGFNPLQIISEKTGKSVAQLKDEMAKGQITFEMVADAMKTATSEGGQFYNAMQAQSKTLMGQWSTLKDNVTALTGEISADISEKLTNKVLPDLIDKVDEFSQMWEDGSLQDAIGTVVSALAAFGTAIVALNLILFINDIMQAKKGVDNFTAATKAGAAAQKLMNAALLKNPYILALAAVVALTAGIVTYAATHKSTATEVVESLEDMSKAYQDSIDDIDKRARAEAAEAQTALVLKDRLFELDEQINSGKLSDEAATKAKEEFGEVADNLNKIIPGVIDNIYDENGAISLQKGTVEELTQAYYDLVSAKAVANAYQDKINLAASNLIEAKEKKSSAEADFARQKADRMGDGSWLGKIWGEHEVKQAADAVDAAAKEVRKYENEIEKFTTEMGTYETKIKELLKSSGLGSNGDGNGTGTGTGNGNGSGGISKVVKKQTEENSKEFEKQYKTLKRSLDREIISRGEYYSQLKKLRDTYFAENSDEWQKYTEELAEFKEDTFDGYLDELNEFKNNALDTMQELSNKQKSLAEGLQAKNFTYESGTINGESFLYLTDLDSENGKLARYNVMLEQLYEKRADLPAKVTEALQGMDIDKGMKYVTAMLKATDEQFNEYIDDLKRNEELTGKVSTQLMSEELEEAKRILEEKFGQLPEDFFGIGADSAESFGEGFMQTLKEAMAVVRETVIAEMNAMIPASITYSAGGIGGSNNITYNNSYTISTAKSTATETRAVLQAAETYNRMSGVTGGN